MTVANVARETKVHECKGLNSPYMISPSTYDALFLLIRMIFFLYSCYYYEQVLWGPVHAPFLVQAKEDMSRLLQVRCRLALL